MPKAKVWRGFATTAASLLVLSIGVSSIADSRAGFLNSKLGTSNYKTIKSKDSTSDDGSYFDSEFSTLEELINAETQVAAQIAQEGAVLLKNNRQALPLNAESEKVTLWGLNSTCPILGGLIASSVVANSEAGQQAYGIQEALLEKGFELNTDMTDFYNTSAMAPYRMRASFFGNEVPGHALIPAFTPTYENPSEYFVGEAPASLYTEDILKSADDTAAVVVISRDSSEAADYSTEMTSSAPGDSFERPLALSQNERNMIALAKEHSTKVIVLINSDSAMEIGELKEDEGIDSILWTGAPGMNGFLGIADVLSGESNPSGHLPDTYAVNVTSAPSMVNFGVYTYTNSSSEGGDLTEADRGDWYLVESEGIYIGYKYYETRYEDSVLRNGNADATEGSTTGSSWNYADEVAYPFGYGLSYTTFDQKLKSVDLEIGGTGAAVVTVTNTGNTAGKSVVQLYVQSPYTQGGLEKSAVQLLDFGKTEILEPGESVDLTIEFDPQYMASYDQSVQKANDTEGAWVLEAGDYYFSIGNGAHEALNNILAKKTGDTANLVSITDEETIHADNALLWTLEDTNTETYSANVENALQSADLNNLIAGSVEYTTRSDWTEGWVPVESITPTEEMMVGLTNNTYSLSENGEGLTWGMDSGLKLVDFITTDENGNYTGVIDYNDPSWDTLVDEITLDETLKFMEANGDGFQSIASVGYPSNGYNDGPIGFVYDQVPGYSQKWVPSDSDEATYVSEDDPYASYCMAVMPTEPVVAATFNKDLVQREGEILGEISLWANLPGIMGPGLCLHRNPYCARNHEYYSEDSMLTNILGTAVCKGGASKGLMMEPKHLAFNHQELNRTGISTFFTEQSGRENELRGFQGALQSNYAMGIMSAFNRIGTVYSGAYEGMLVQIVRNEWGFTGWITTDLINGADYQNWKDAILGGSSATLSNLSTYAETQWGTMADSKSAILKDTKFQSKIKSSMKYYLYTTARSNAMNGITSDTETIYVRTWWQNTILGIEIGLGILTAVLAILYILGLRKNNKKGDCINHE